MDTASAPVTPSPALTAAEAATTPAPSPARAPGDEDEQRLVLYGVSWGQYEELLRWVGDRHLYLTYDRGKLEIMAPSPIHELYKKQLGQILDALTEELGLACGPLGSTTFRREDLARGFEPDECFYLQNEPRIRGKEKLDLAVDPPPDLVIEVDVASRSTDRLPIFAALGVPEVWRFDCGALTMYALFRDGRIEARDESIQFSGLRSEDLEGLLRKAEGIDNTAWRRSVRAWVRDVLIPRTRGGA